MRPRPLCTFAVAAVVMASPGIGGQARSGGFERLVDDFLETFATRHPSIAAGNGLHQHDDRLETMDAASIASELAGWRALETRLATIPPASLTPDERVDHRILDGLLDAWILDIDVTRTWQKNPMVYASALSDGVHNLMTMASAPPAVRADRIVRKLEGVPALLDAARTNLVRTPRVMADRGVRMFRGAAGMLRTDVPLAFAEGLSPAERARLLDATGRAAGRIEAFADWFAKERLPQADASFAVGQAGLEARYRAEELIDLPVPALLAIGERELAKAQAGFEAAAARVDRTRSPLAVWADVLKDHPSRGALVPAAQRAVDELQAFVVARGLASIPSQEPVVVAAAPEFDLGLASMHSSPPLEPTPVKSYFYVTDARAEWPAAQQDAWLQKFNVSTLTVIASHEVMPGHYLHSLFMRQTPGRIRRIWIGLNPFPQPSSGQDGWAHYAEQMMVEQGFRKDDPRYEMAQLSEAMTRICRLIAGIRLHTGAWTVDDAARFFEERAHLPAPAARQEAERGTYDPTYGGYFLGKIAALTLRDDYRAAQGKTFDLRAFHERVMRNGIAPWWAHRQLLLPGDTRPLLR